MKLEPQAEYDERMATDATFHATEQQLNRSFAEDGRVRKPYWKTWTGTLYVPNPNRKHKAGRKPRRPGVPSRKIVCVETGKVFANVAALAGKIGLGHSTIYGKISKRDLCLGKIYRYETEEEKGKL